MLAQLAFAAAVSTAAALAPCDRTTRELELTSRGITDAAPLAACVSLRKLALGGNSISDLSPLSGLKDLEYLDVSYNPVTDLTALAGLTKLRELQAHNDLVADVAPLAGLKELVSLGLHDNRIKDLSPLKGLPKLTSLTAAWNPLQDTSCPVAGATKCVTSEAACKTDSKPESLRFPLWDSTAAVAGLWTSKSPASCINAGYPTFRASLPEADAWIQVVEVSMPDPKTGRTPWTFVDVGSESRAKGEPFYTTGSSWQDTPWWDAAPEELRKLPKKRRDWRGRLYAVRVKDGAATPVAGVEWGYSWVLGKSSPEPFAPKALDIRKWNDADRRRLRRDFPTWRFLIP